MQISKSKTILKGIYIENIEDGLFVLFEWIFDFFIDLGKFGLLSKEYIRGDG